MVHNIADVHLSQTDSMLTVWGLSLLVVGCGTTYLTEDKQNQTILK
jgi:uncharacterized protein YjeT (DUF2065 family)